MNRTAGNVRHARPLLCLALLWCGCSSSDSSSTPFVWYKVLHPATEVAQAVLTGTDSGVMLFTEQIGSRAELVALAFFAPDRSPIVMHRNPVEAYINYVEIDGNEVHIDIQPDGKRKVAVVAANGDEATFGDIPSDDGNLESQTFALSDPGLDALDRETTKYLKDCMEFNCSLPNFWSYIKSAAADTTKSWAWELGEQIWDKVKERIGEVKQKFDDEQPAERYFDQPVSIGGVPPSPQKAKEHLDELEDRTTGKQPQTDHYAGLKVYKEGDDGNLEETTFDGKEPEPPEPGQVDFPADAEFLCLQEFRAVEGLLTLTEVTCVKDSAECDAQVSPEASDHKLFESSGSGAACQQRCLENAAEGKSYSGDTTAGEKCYAVTRCVQTFAASDTQKGLTESGESCAVDPGGCTQWMRGTADGQSFSATSFDAWINDNGSSPQYPPFLVLWGYWDAGDMGCGVAVSPVGLTGTCEHTVDSSKICEPSYLVTGTPYAPQSNGSITKGTGSITITRNDGKWVDGSFSGEGFSKDWQTSKSYSGEFHIAHPDNPDCP